MKTIKINKDNLIVHTSIETLIVQGCNGSGLYEVIDESGDVDYLVRNELKKICDINLVDETLEMLHNYEYGRVYTDDMLNFIDESEYNGLDEQYRKDFYKVTYEVV